MKESPDEKKFMREKIVKPPVDWHRRVRRILCFILLALIFGVISAVSFVASKPFAEKLFGEEEESPAIPITIEKDDEPAVPETAPQIVETEPEKEDSPEEIESIVQHALDTYVYDGGDIDGLNKALQSVFLKAGRGIVTISSVKQNKDWFDNPVESSGQYSGVILAENANEIVIFTVDDAITDADSIRVTFGEGTTVPGEVRQTDTIIGIAVISVNADSVTESTKDWIAPVELGNSYSVKMGDLVLVAGSPAGQPNSIKRGMISYVAKGVQAVDRQTRLFYTDFGCNAEKGSFILDQTGRLIGWVTDKYEAQPNSDTSMVMSVSEYKGILQKLSNGIPMPYFGVRGQDVTDAMNQEGIPKGVYLTESVAEGPAYRAGIQNGDILISLNGLEISSVRDLQSRLEGMESGEEIPVVIARKGIENYKEIEYNVTLGAR